MSQSDRNKSQSLNPEVLKDTIRLIITEDFDGNFAAAADAFNATPAVAKRGYRPITPSILYAILSDRSHLKLSHLQMICDHLSVPVGAFLLFTRLKSSKRDGKTGDVQYVQSVIKILEDIAAEDELGIKELKAVAAGVRQLDLL